MSHFLPLGSVVLLKGAERRLMIVGRVQQSVATGKLYEYSACVFPVGYMGSEELYMFNGTDIESVSFVGCQDEDELRFRDAMEKTLKEHTLEASALDAEHGDGPSDVAESHAQEVTSEDAGVVDDNPSNQDEAS